MTMQAHIVRLTLRSALGTPLAADTLWGHLAWAIRWRDGVAALESWLEYYERGEPPLIIGDPAPRGYLPKPVIPGLPAPAEPPKLLEWERGKAAHKREWISRAGWERITPSLSASSLQTALDVETSPPSDPTHSTMTHAAINRFTGGTAQEGGGTLFTTEREYHSLGDNDAQFDVWALSDTMTAEQIRELFETALHGGYGRDASAGLGRIEVDGVDSIDWPVVEGANACVLLGPAKPSPGDPHRGFFSVGVRCGRLGGDFAIGATPGGKVQRQKRPFRCLLRGTILAAPEPPSFIGSLVGGVHDWPGIRHYAITPALPVRLDSALNETLWANLDAQEGAA